MAYSTAWLIIVAAGCVAVVAVYMMIRRVTSGYLRALVCALILAMMLTPAPVPEHPLNYAPAFIVAVFEGIFQASGNPGVAMRLLVAGAVLAIACVTLGTLGLRRFRRGSAPQVPAVAGSGDPD